MKQQNPQLLLLQPFVGKWTTTGKIYATAHTPEMNINGFDTYEWLPGGQFLLHKVNVYMGKERTQSNETIGYDKLTDSFKIQYVDAQGKDGIFIATVNGKHWTFIGKTLRFNGTFSPDDMEITGTWEQCSKGKDWEKYIEIKLVKD